MERRRVPAQARRGGGRPRHSSNGQSRAGGARRSPPARARAAAALPSGRPRSGRARASRRGRPEPPSGAGLPGELGRRCWLALSCERLPQEPEPPETHSRDALLANSAESPARSEARGYPPSPFLDGQRYYEQGSYKQALKRFENIKDTDFQAMYQLGVMYYDGLGTKKDPERGVEYMNEILNSDSPEASHLKFAAAYNLGRAYYEGCGVKHSVEEAERATANDDTNMLAKKIDCHPIYLAKGAAMAAFYLARCLQLGRGIEQDRKAAEKYYSKACYLDPVVASHLESAANLGII